MNERKPWAEMGLYKHQELIKTRLFCNVHLSKRVKRYRCGDRPIKDQRLLA